MLGWCIWNEINMQKLLESKGSKNHCRFSQKHLSQRYKYARGIRKLWLRASSLCVWSMIWASVYNISKCLMFEIPTVRKVFSFSFPCSHHFSFRFPRSVFFFLFQKFSFLWDMEHQHCEKKMTKINTPHRFGFLVFDIKKIMSSSTMCDICAGTVDVKRTPNLKGKVNLMIYFHVNYFWCLFCIQSVTCIFVRKITTIFFRFSFLFISFTFE